MPDFSVLLEQGDKNGDGKLTRDEAPAGPAKQHFLYIDANKDGLMTREEWESMAAIYRRSENALLALRASHNGRAISLAWKQTRGLPYVPTPLIYGGKVYLVRNGGLASCLEAQTGKPLYQDERLGVLGDYYSSPIAAGGKVCIVSQSGVVVIYGAGEKLEVLARNPLEETVMATPAVIGRTLYVRTVGHLYAFEEPVPF